VRGKAEKREKLQAAEKGKGMHKKCVKGKEEKQKEKERGKIKRK